MRRLVASLGTLLLFSGVAGNSAAAHPSNGSPPDHDRAGAGCIPWEIVPVNGTDPYEEFQGMDGLSATDFWAVGDASAAPHVPTIFHWDGTAWNRGPAQSAVGYLEDVDVIDAQDGWAVGTLIMRWNGAVWSVVPPGVDDAGLQGVSGVDPSDVWAVGTQGYDQGVIEHWDGTAWAPVPFEHFPEGERLYNVKALATDDAWAVGERLVGVGERPIIEHWDGTAWTNVRIPFATSHGVLLDVDASGPDDVWAAGNDSGRGLVYHWDGAQWTRIKHVPYRFGGFFRGVSVLAPDDVWVAGYHTIIGPPIAAHWDGSSWTITNVTTENAWFNTIKAFTPDEVWAGGHAGGLGIRSERLGRCP